MNIPRIIDHKTMGPLLDQLQREPEFQPGAHEVLRGAWYREQVWLEFPSGEAAEDPLKSLALIGRNFHESVDLDGKEQFDAQGLEGKIRVKKDLFGALMNLRDLLPEHRGRIVTGGAA